MSTLLHTGREAGSNQETDGSKQETDRQRHRDHASEKVPEDHGLDTSLPSIVSCLDHLAVSLWSYPSPNRPSVYGLNPNRVQTQRAE